MAEIPNPTSIEALIEGAVSRTIEQLLEPYLVRLSKPEPLVYTVSQAAEVLQVSTDTIGRLVKRGVLDRVPHLDGKTLIPKVSIEHLVAGAGPDGREDKQSTGKVTQIDTARPRRASGA
ncbi:MAG: helix-turn-helix domain-containing protein [Acidimicrobiales bacterium]